MVNVLAARVLVTPRDFERSLAFYEGPLGLVRFREFGRAPGRGVVLFLGGAYLELTEAGTTTDPAQGPRLWLQVPDVSATCAALTAEGVAVDQAPERKPWGLIEATVHDPDGLALVLVEVPADHPLRRDTRGEADPGPPRSD